MNEVKKTTDYSIFKKHPQNRDIDPLNVKKLVASIKARNLLEFQPISCDEDMRVLCGQHRLEAAKQLGVGVYYFVRTNSTHEDMVLLSTNQKVWEIMDYVHYHISLGNTVFQQLLDQSKVLDLGFSEYIRMFPMDRGTMTAAIRTGSFKMPSPEALAHVAELSAKTKTILNALRPFVYGVRNCLSSKYMTRAIQKLLNNPICDVDVLINKMRLKSESIHKCTDAMSYYLMLRDIYNYRNQNPID